MDTTVAGTGGQDALIIDYCAEHEDEVLRIIDTAEFAGVSE